MRSNLNFEDNLGVKKSKNVKSLKIVKSFLAIFGKDTGHKGLKFCTVPYIISIYTFYFIKISPN